MPLQPSPGVTEVWLATPEAAGHFDPSHLGGADRAKFAAIRTKRRRLDWASSRAMLGAVTLRGNEKPSLSHSHGHAALALAPGALAIGVDVEWLVPRNFTGIADIAYAQDEAAFLASLNDPADLCSAFYEFWTLKEAFAKALSMPLLDALRHCCFIDPSGARRAAVPTMWPWRATVFAPRPQLRLAVVRMPGIPGPIAKTLRTSEWPRPKASEWPVVLDLASQDR